MVNLYDHATTLSSPYNIQIKKKDVHYPFPYLSFKTSKLRKGITIPLPPPSLSYPLLSSPFKLPNIPLLDFSLFML